MKPELEWTPPGLPPDLVRAVAAKLVSLEPDTAALVVTGSYAKGVADEASDLDVRAVTRREPREPYRTWFEPRPGGRALHVSAGARSIQSWLATRERPNTWALGFPVAYEGAYLWAERDVRERLGDPPTSRHPAAPPELEDFVEALVKVRRASRAGDQLGAGWHAQTAGALAPGLLRRLNPERVVRDRRDALEAALTLTVAPEGYREDLTACLGLARDRDVGAAAHRLGLGVLALLRERDPGVDSQPGVAEALRDGTFEELLRG